MPLTRKTLALSVVAVFAFSAVALAAPTPKHLPAQPRLLRPEVRQVVSTADLLKAVLSPKGPSLTTFSIFGPNNKCTGGNGSVCECSGSCEANATACRCL